jgi:hypothetical protein
VGDGFGPATTIAWASAPATTRSRNGRQTQLHAQVVAANLTRANTRYTALDWVLVA